MVAAITPPGNSSPHGNASISVSGHTASTAYEAVISWPSGRTQVIQFVTDGSGNATLPNVTPAQDDRGTATVTTRISLKVPVTTITAPMKVV